MCGINGYISKKSNSIVEELSKMNQLIYHRGPDEDGFYMQQESEFVLGMAMRRLSIIDLTTGKQPMYSNNKQKVIVFNGEIYNYKSLKKDLLQKGYSFDTESDTEVVVNLFDCYGTDSIKMLDGMFAFAIYDISQKQIIIARDFFGEKPLYYYRGKERFVWGSELKSIVSTLDAKPEIDTTALNLYFQLTYIPAPYSIFRNIKKLESNHYIVLDCKTLEFKISEVAHDHKKYHNLTKETAIKTTHDLVQQSVASRSISDVPLGTFLSGGVDSSIVSLCLAQQSSQKINTFSIGFNKKSFDESEKSRLVAKLINSNHHEFIIDNRDFENSLSTVILNFDEPFADSSSLASYVVAHKTRQHVTVALTGDGGDEVFGGYNKYLMGMLNQKYTSIIPNPLHKFVLDTGSFFLKTKEDSRGVRFKLNRLLKAINYDFEFYYNIVSLGFQENELEALLHEDFIEQGAFEYYKERVGAKVNSLKDYRNVDRILSLEGDMLVKVDRTSMLTSLECRAPFLNKEIWNFTNQLPDNYLINGLDKKHILKEAFKPYFPKDFLNKSKKGFGVPVGDFLKNELKSELTSYIDPKFIESQGIFNYDYILKLVTNHINSKVDNTFRVWTFYCFQKWYKMTFDN